jgi:8-oxo-dGTP pyrophosphatase MutT (NUDIX family)
MSSPEPADLPRLLVVLREVALARSADRTEPRLGNVLEVRARRDASVSIALGRVIDEAAGFTHPLHALKRIAGAPETRPAGSVAQMEIDRPAAGEELNTGQETVPRQAATVILLRGGADELQVLLVQRNPQARFMGGAWVFPGGAVDRHEGEGDGALRAAAIRELAEEAGVRIGGPEELVPFSRWITPAQVKIRFDTWFFLAVSPTGVEPSVDGNEVVDARWYRPDAALRAASEGEIFLVFPTIKHLEQLSGFGSAQALIEHASGREVRPVQPRVLLSGETARVVLPGEPGYEDSPRGAS